MSRGVALWDLLVALGVVGLGLFLVAGARAIHVLPSYARIGPRFFPYLAGAGLLATGTLLAWQALRGRAVRPAEEEGADPDAPVDWRAAGWIVAGLVLNVLLMERAGFLVAATALFTLTAWGLGGRRLWVSLLSGLLLAVIAYLSFTRLLDLHLP